LQKNRAPSAPGFHRVTIILGKKSSRSEPSSSPESMQQFLKPATAAARTGIVATELFLQMLAPTDDAKAALHARF
jgi:hypothetical protein